jgi:hypothetical protein
MSNDKRVGLPLTVGEGRSVATPEDSLGTWSVGDDGATVHSDVQLSERLAQANLQMHDMQVHMDELIEANLRLRAEVSEMTLKWLMDKTDDHE